MFRNHDITYTLSQLGYSLNPLSCFWYHDADRLAPIAERDVRGVPLLVFLRALARSILNRGDR